MASDSLASEADATTTEIDKIWISGGLLFGYSGNLAVRDPLKKAISERLDQSPLEPNAAAHVAASMLCAVMRPVLEKAYANFVGAPGENAVEKIGGSLLIIGHNGNAHWLLEIDPNNTASDYTGFGFHTIGSGSVAAHVSRGLLQHYSLPGHQVKHLRLLAYRTIETCIRVLGGAYGVGGRIQLWQSGSDEFEEVTGEDLLSVSEGIQQWTGIERESLDRVFAQESDEAAVEPPLPDPLDSP